MDNVRTSMAPPCQSSTETTRKSLEREFPPMRERRARGFSVVDASFSVQDLKELSMVEEEEEGGSSHRGVGNEDPLQVADEDCFRVPNEDCLRSLVAETNSSKASTSDVEARPSSKNTSDWRGFFKSLRKKSNYLQTFPPLSVPKFTRRKSKRARDNMLPTLNPSLDADFVYFKSSWKNFSLSELRHATNNFSHENLIGEGGYSEVYKGHLKDGQLVAIKRLSGGTSEEMTADFLSELGIIVHVNHPNLAKLIGYGVEGGMHLVLQLSPHGSLASILRGSKGKLDWSTRYKIALGTADGLLYLHEGCQRRIIHKDIKAANVLLTEDFEPQISDFGLAKWLPEQWTHHVVSKFEGTFGYLPPEYFMHGIVDEKTDVYAYGVVLLELITGRLALDNSQQSLVMWAKPLLARNNISELVDPSLGDSFDNEQMSRLILMSSLCIHQSSVRRPQMNQIVQILRQDEGSYELTKQFKRPTLQRTYSEELLDAEEYNSTKYLNDMNRQMQISLE